MAGFSTKTFKVHDEYETPRSAWVNIKDYIPRDKVIWDPFYCSGLSGNYLKELGFDIIHENEDFFESNRGDVIISNPPFSIKKQVFTRLKELNKPFIVISPSSMINTQYIRELFSDCDDKLQVIIPRKRIHFIKKIEGKIPDNYKSSCNFDCFYFCWKINLPRDITWLN